MVTNTVRRGVLPFAIASLLAVSPLAVAQNVTTSAVTGVVVDASGNPVPGATVTIVHVPSGTTKTVSTNASGRYNSQGLRVGGPYDITVTKSGLAEGEKDQVYLQLGQVSAINLVMQPSEANAQELGAVTVSANSMNQIFSPDNRGLSTNISQRELQATPTPGRSIADVARLDPRITIMDRGEDTISMMGLNNRYNTISVDGVGQGDPFGLNGNGLPTTGTPISQDTIAEYHISTADYDVASDAVGAVINAVTKSGTNEFHGSVYYAYRNANKLVGDAGWLDEDRGYHGYNIDWTGGATVGGPIIKDKLFFFVNYEEEKTTGIGADSANGLDPSLGNGPSTSNKLSPGDLDKVIAAANDLGLTPGSMGSGGVDLTDKRYLAKLDWNITDNHRASVTWQRTRETQPIVQGNGASSVGLSSFWYTKNIDTKNTVLHLFDDWTDNFSTEAKFGYQHFQQVRSVATQQTQVVVDLGTGADGVPNGTSPTVNLGEDQYSHYNVLNVRTLRGYLAGTLFLGDHTFKGGIDFRRHQIYNLFGRTEFGAYTFWGLNNFVNGSYNKYEIYQPAPGFDINDVAAQWTLRQYAFFLQDTWQPTLNLSIQYGVRVNRDYTDDSPVYNPTFQAAYGIRNNATIDGMSLVEPRVSFNLSFDTERKTQLRGGFGLFESNPPMVWMTNPFSNNGMTTTVFQAFGDESNPPAFSADPFNPNLPTSPTAQRMTVDSIDPNFQLPSVWKFTLAFDRELPFWGTIFSAQYEYIKTRNAIWYQDPDIGAPDAQRLPDGRYQFWATPGQAPVSSDVRANGDPRFSGSSTYLRNTHSGDAHSLTLALKKPFSAHWFGSLGVTLGNARDVNPGTSSQASSNFRKRAWVNPNEPELGLSNQNIKRSVKLALTWQHTFFGNYATSVSGLYVGHTGRPYSWIFGNDVNGDGFDTDLVFIPREGQVAFAPGTTQKQIDQFYAFIQNDPYLRKHQGAIAERNRVDSGWVNDLDLSFRQEVPGIFRGNKGEIRLDIYNFLNLINKNWGQESYVPFPYMRTLANYAGVDADGKYIYSLPTGRNGNYQPQQKVIYDAGTEAKTSVVSRWSAMVTLRYTF
jgi:outer membrane receptor for ferrienterochelin and colicin